MTEPYCETHVPPNQAGAHQNSHNGFASGRLFGLLARPFCLFFATLTALATLTSCDDDDDAAAIFHPRKATVSLIVSVEGLGDDGFDDSVAKGMFNFVNSSQAQMTIYRPDSLPEARQIYEQWLADNATADSAFLIVGSSTYADFVRQSSLSLTGKGSSILLIDVDGGDLPDGVCALSIRHYGASYLAGAMSSHFNTAVMAAAPGIASLNEAIEGFSDGFNAHALRGLAMETYYIAEDSRGFGMTDSVYRMSRGIVERDSLIIFPLLGGAQNGVLRACNENFLSAAFVVGMDVDKSSICPSVPFSVIYSVDQAVCTLLTMWDSGEYVPDVYELSLGNGGASISINDNFLSNWFLPPDWLTDGYFRDFYDEYYEEAVRKEKEHMGL